MKKIITIISFLFFCTLLGGCGKIKEKVSVSFLACQEADITFIQYQNHTVIIDTGEDTCQKEVLFYLEKKNIDTIDFMVLTHPDKDHIGNALSILKKWNTKMVYMTNYHKGSLLEQELLDYIETENIDHEILTQSKKIDMDGLEFLIAPPLQPYDSSNNSSLVVWMNTENMHFFFGADIKKNRIQELLKQELKQTQIVKLPYHGRYVNNMRQLLEQLKPEKVIITASKADQKTIKLLEDLNIDYEYTKENITIVTDGNKWERK